MGPLQCKALVSFLAFSFAGISQAQVQSERWHLKIEDLEHQTKVDAIVRFTEDGAESCIAGNWKRLIVESVALRDENFFPLATPLAYQREGSQLTLGRTTKCDDYLFVSGDSAESIIQGAYKFVGIMGASKLGDFYLKKIAP